MCPATQLDLLIAWNIPYWFEWNLAAESSAFRILHTACACARVLHSSIQHSNRMQLFGVTFTSIFRQIELIFFIDFLLLLRFKYFGIIITSPAFQTPRTSLIVVNVFIFIPPPSNAQIENRKLLLWNYRWTTVLIASVCRILLRLAIGDIIIATFLLQTLVQLQQFSVNSSSSIFDFGVTLIGAQYSASFECIYPTQSPFSASNTSDDLFSSETSKISWIWML